MFDDDETLQMYIEESLDHLDDIESDLLTIEAAGENIDIDLVNNVFRAAHSIKGGAGFMGLTTIKDISHHLENILGLFRNKALIPDSAKISVLLKGFDELKNLLNNIETSNEVDVEDLINALEQIPQSSVSKPSTQEPSVQEPSAQTSSTQKISIQPEEQDEVSKTADIILSDGRKFPEISFSEIEQCKSEGKNIFLIEYDLIHDIQAKEKKPMEIFDNLQKTGTIIDSRIDLDSVGTLSKSDLPDKIPLQFLFASIIEYDMTEILFDIEKQYIHHISDNMIISNDTVDTDAKNCRHSFPKKTRSRRTCC